MRAIDWTSPWKLAFKHPVTGKNHSIDAVVPGNTAADLMRAKVIPDLYKGAHALQAKIWERTDFTYTTRFKKPALKKGERLLLCFDGIDTVADIKLNGRFLTRFENMFIPHEADITRHVKKVNLLTIVIRNILDYADEQAKTHGFSGDEFTTIGTFDPLYARKAQHMFGWDIAPRLLFGGLWRPVRLAVHSEMEILRDACSFAVRKVDLEAKTSEAEVSWGFAVAKGTDWKDYTLTISGRCGNSGFTLTPRLDFTHGREFFTIENARFWWPLGYGEQPLYDLSFTLAYKGKDVDTHALRVGVRTVALDLHTDVADPAKSRFTFKCNNETVYIRGSNWVPVDALHMCDEARIPKILNIFTETHCNMVRCWGGNVYEDHAFFDYCDAHGILVWQDFMFGCAYYPQNDHFLARVRHEAETVVKRLRNHPSLALWAGDNEIDWFVFYFSGGNPARLPSHNAISRRVLKEAVNRFDPSRPYLPSSPYIPDEAYLTGKDNITPEQHLWGPRGYFKDDFYRKNNAVFASEIGYHGCPAKKSLEKFLSRDKVWGSFNNEEWIVHAAGQTGREDGPQGRRNYLMLSQLRHLFGDSVNADNIDEFILASQITQAEAKKYFIEMFRAGRPRRTGLIWWNMIDGWPQFSDAVVDYYFEKKLAWHHIRRCQEPVALLVAENPEGALEIVAVNDTRKEASGVWSVTEAVTGRKSAGGTYQVAPNGRTVLGAVAASDKNEFLLLEWEQGDEKRWNHFVNGPAPWDFRAYASFLGILKNR